jgi:uncharacterized membrane protein
MPSVSRIVLGGFFLAAGALHFIKPRPYESIMPEALPAHRELVYLSGVAEMAGGAGVLADPTRRAAGWWLIATMLAVFPANINMAIEAESFKDVPEPLLWARLPLQAAIVYWIWRVAVREPTSGARRR